MRLNEKYYTTIKEAAKKYFGVNTTVYLFGSRVDDSKKGGDIDLYIEPEGKDDLLKKKLKMIAELHKILGEQKIDIVVKRSDAFRFIEEVAKSEGKLL